VLPSAAKAVVQGLPAAMPPWHVTAVDGIFQAVVVSPVLT
jgi:hypothetical protein